MHFIRRAAARTLATQPARQLSPVQRSSTRLALVQASKPALYRAFHQSRIQRADETDKIPEPVAQAIADDAVADELKDEAFQAAGVAEAAAEAAARAGEEGATEAAANAADLAEGAAVVADAAAGQAAGASSADTAEIGSESMTNAAGAAEAAATTAAFAAGAAASASRPFERSFAGGPSSPPSDTVLYIGNLFFEVNAAQLRAEFEKFGLVTDTRIATDERGLSRGFGFVTFDTADSAARAIREGDQKTFQNRRMAVQLHRARPRAPPRREQEPRSPSPTLFIGNLNYSMSDRDLNDLFRNVRDVLDVRVAIDRRTGNPRGFAHADFVDEPAATRAKDMLDAKMVHGRPLRVSYADRNNRMRGDKSQAE